MPEITVFHQLLILMVVVWTMAVLLRRVGFPTILGELIMGVVLGPAVLGWIEPSEIIEILAEMGIFFIMLHTGVTTEPREFYEAIKDSLGIAVVGAITPFAVSMGVALAFGLPLVTSLFVGLVMTATAVVITIKSLADLGMQNTPMARIIIAASILDDILTLIFFSLVLGIVRNGSIEPVSILIFTGKTALFFGVAFIVGYYLYPLFKHPFRNRRGKGFTFVLVLALALGLFAEAIGLHIILGAYLAGLFFEEKVASRALIQKVEDRLYGIAYSFLGPIFFISLGLHITLDAFNGSGLWLVIALTLACIIGQIISAGGMARLKKFTWTESLVVGVGMSGRSGMAFILASLGISMGAIDIYVFSVLVATIFLLDIFTPVGLKGCDALLKRQGRSYGTVPPSENGEED